MKHSNTDVWQSNSKQVPIDQVWDLNAGMGERENNPSNGLFPEPAESLNPQSGLLIKRDETGRIVEQRQTRDVFGARRPGAEPVTRLQAKPPRDAADLIDELRGRSEQLSRDLAYYESVKGSNPLQPRILQLKLEIAKLQEKLNPLQAELSELLATPIPQDLIVQQLDAAQVRTQQLSREATESKLRQTITEDLDLRFEDATPDDKQTYPAYS